jgi:hypothetical protein
MKHPLAIHHRENPVVVRHRDAWSVYGEPGCILRANIMGEVVYSNLDPDAPEYRRMLRALRAYRSDGNSPNGEG